MTVATDGHELYASELAHYLKRRHNLGAMTRELAAELKSVGRAVVEGDRSMAALALATKSGSSGTVAAIWFARLTKSRS